MENKILNIKNLKIYLYYYLLVMVGYVLTLVSTSVHPGVIATVLLIVLYAECVIRLGYLSKDKQRDGIRSLFFCLTTIDILAALYFIYNLMSGIWCVSFGMPMSVWAGDFTSGILTMIFYLIGRVMNDEERDRFYTMFAVAVYLVCIVGLILYIFAPQFYLDYLFDYHYISKADVSTMRIRMISVIGSILVGYLSVAAMLASAHIVMKSDGKRGKLLVLLGFVFAFLSNQRSAMVVAIIVLLYINYLVFFTFKLIPKKYFIAECGFISFVFVAICVLYFGVILKIYYRLVSLPGAVGQRSDQWVGAINNMRNLWLGNGLGANGHRAAGITEHLIADGGIAKLFVEMGIIGTAIFAYAMILAFRYSIRNLRDCSVEIGIIAITLLQSIGSNILEFQLATPIFWFALGVIGGRSIAIRKEKGELK